MYTSKSIVLFTLVRTESLLWCDEKGREQCWRRDEDQNNKWLEGTHAKYNYFSSIFTWKEATIKIFWDRVRSRSATAFASHLFEYPVEYTTFLNRWNVYCKRFQAKAQDDKHYYLVTGFCRNKRAECFPAMRTMSSTISETNQDPCQNLRLLRMY